jgi:hypothetical protein
MARKLCENCGHQLPNAVGPGVYCSECGEPVAPTKISPLHRMEQGKWYQIVYRIEGQRVSRVMTVQYLGWNEILGEHSLNLRPLAGTQALHDSAIEATAPAPDPRPKLPKRVRS